MACTRGLASPDAHTKLRLFADSGGFCQNPDCNTNLFISIGESDFHIAEMAHVFSASDIGPRSDKKLSKVDRGNYDNLILLCPTCHTIIDKAEDEYPDSLLREWKTNHIERIRSLFNIKLLSNRHEARLIVEKLLKQNKAIFDIYGPLTDERFNPESSMPKIWKKKILKSILPNNRMILSIIDVNYVLLTDDEKIVLEQFRQHVNDFEDKHINNSQIQGIQFPSDMGNIFL